MSKTLSDSTITAWARLVRTSQFVIGAIEADLKAAGMPPLHWYDVLLELERAEGGELRPREIARETLFTRYNVTRLVDRLERQGLAKRVACLEDARGAVVQITDKGRKLRHKMWPVYATAIERHFANKLDQREVGHLARLLRKIIG